MKLDLESLVLRAGAHSAASGEACFIEAASIYHGEPFADRDVDNFCPRIEAYGRALNDWLPQKDRQRLKAFIRENVKAFTSQIDGTRWLDLPFAFVPWWDRRAELAAKVGRT